jgi:hypothetical protein
MQYQLIGEGWLVTGPKPLKTGLEPPAAHGVGSGKSDQDDGEAPSAFLPRHTAEQSPDDEQVHGQ